MLNRQRWVLRGGGANPEPGRPASTTTTGLGPAAAPDVDDEVDFLPPFMSLLLNAVDSFAPHFTLPLHLPFTEPLFFILFFLSLFLVNNDLCLEK